MRRVWLGLACLASLALSRSALAGTASLSTAEQSALLAGEVVARPLHFERDGEHYLGGVSYALVRASPEAILAALSNPDDLPYALPRTESARLVDAQSGAAWIELVQGSRGVSARYTVKLEREPSGDELRLALDRSRPHDVSDLFGYFRARPFPDGRTVVTVAVALDLGSGLASLFFSDAVERVILSSPAHIRSFVEPRALALVEPRWQN
ncbi:MAG TPA: SRPBCC family protein [Polyangiaceae bacterium]